MLKAKRLVAPLKPKPKRQTPLAHRQYGKFDSAALKEQVGDRWLDLLRSLAPELDEACDNIADHVPCPVHGGKDGFRLFKDAEETGGGICNTCGPFPDGIALLMWANDWTFLETVRNIQVWLDEEDSDADSE